MLESILCVIAVRPIDFSSGHYIISREHLKSNKTNYFYHVFNVNLLVSISITENNNLFNHLFITKNLSFAAGDRLLFFTVFIGVHCENSDCKSSFEYVNFVIFFGRSSIYHETLLVHGCEE